MTQTCVCVNLANENKEKERERLPIETLPGSGRGGLKSRTFSRPPVSFQFFNASESVPRACVYRHPIALRACPNFLSLYTPSYRTTSLFDHPLKRRFYCTLSVLQLEITAEDRPFRNVSLLQLFKASLDVSAVVRSFG